ncbi:hypothetical protein Cni_G29469 [Canna indica]|uniref:Retrotransposon gag domain-containing protein n=1 Tax=Canna indica TaxID=4628 RepID=A0AAQ3L579_9LILI|nr:hypothetical protein Cni_G29469 [Canna indica]
MISPLGLEWKWRRYVVAEAVPVVPQAVGEGSTVHIPMAPLPQYVMLLPGPHGVLGGEESWESRMLRFHQIGKERFGSFGGSTDPMIARRWLAGVEDTFKALRCKEEEKVELATFYLINGAREWWRAQVAARDGADISWAKLKAGSRTVAEYEAKFDRLSEFCPQMVATEEDKAEHFFRGLNFAIQDRMSSHDDLGNYSRVVARALLVEHIHSMITQQKQKDRQGQLPLPLVAGGQDMSQGSHRA